MLVRSGLILLTVFAMIATACGSSSGGDEVAATDQTTTTTSAAPEAGGEGEGDESGQGGESGDADAGDDAGDTADSGPVEIDIERYFEVAAGFDQTESDASLPDVTPEVPTGAYGYSRYVYNKQGDQVVPTLIEGPAGLQVRCQELDQACSRGELAELYESGDPIPDYLEMDRETLGELVDQLAKTQETVDLAKTIEEACAAGYTASSQQSPNMGIHMQYPGGTSAEFDPARPTMVLYAREGGETLGLAEQGQCVDRKWTGETGYESVGAVFTQTMTPDHPDAFAGQIDNWHIHFNTCSGEQEGSGIIEADTFEESIAGQDGLAVDAGQCSEQGGFFMEVIPVWMMHAYTDPDFEGDGGVFAMFNPNIWPLAETPDQIEQVRIAEIDDGIAAPITNFDFGDVEAEVGETIVFSNSDAVPHTVTAGSASAPSGAFDSGVFGTGQAFEIEFDEAGSYDIFCVLHPQMSGTVTVG